ncbi:hypothetical protein KKC06_06410 [Patescibacteria group bacterium]|nr:hypothetical protein [Patescibacteria group bacterium]
MTINNVKTISNVNSKTILNNNLAKKSFVNEEQKSNHNVQDIQNESSQEEKIVINKRQQQKLRKFWKLGNKDFNTHYFDINENGELVVLEGNYQYNIFHLVKKFNSSLEIFFPSILKERVNDLIDLYNLFIKYYRYKGKFFYHFPMKVNQNREYLLSLVAEGANLEVASYNELCLVKKIWEEGNFHSNIRVVCNGPKTKPYLELIEELQSNNLSVVPIIEHYDELEFLKSYKGDTGIRVDLNLGTSSRWDKKINRFGFPPNEILELGKIKNLKILHYHIGSQIPFLEDMIAPIKRAMDIYVKLRKLNPSLDTLNIGGGMPIPYDRKKMYASENVIKNVVHICQNMADKKDIPHPNIICEWGWYVTAPSQITIFEVIAEKDITKGNAKKWYIIDGSFINDLPDTWALHQKWHVVPIHHLHKKKLARTWLGGSSCDSDDKYINHGNYILLPSYEHLEDHESLYIAFFDTGAYQDALSSKHCLLSPPARVMAHNGEAHLIRKRKTPDEMGRMFGW